MMGLRVVHRVAMLLPAARRALDVGEEKGDGTGR
jgi:hypothetical protein